MNETLHRAVENFATITFEWLETDARVHRVKRSDILELFIDTLRAMEQNIEQED